MVNAKSQQTASIRPMLSKLRYRDVTPWSGRQRPVADGAPAHLHTAIVEGPARARWSMSNHGELPMGCSQSKNIRAKK
jgi:hypothetical protein